MKALLELVRDICLLRRGPQDAPYSPALLGALLLAAIVLDVAVEAEFPVAPVPKGVDINGVIALSSLIGLALPWLAMRLADMQSRFIQTAITLLGIEMLFELLSIPARLLVGVLPTPEGVPTPRQGVGAMLMIAILIWWLLARGHVLRHALNVRFSLGVLIALIFTIVERVIVVLVYHEAR